MKSLSLSDQIYQDLENKIITGEIPKGTLLTELKLSETYGVSRTPIREVLSKLASEKLINTEKKKNIVQGINSENLSDLFSLREQLEPVVIEKFIMSYSNNDLKTLNDILDLHKFYIDRSDIYNISMKDYQFHNFICENCSSECYSEALLSVLKKIQIVRSKSFMSHKRLNESYYEHQQILDAIKSKDVIKAQNLVIQHIKNAKEYMI